MVILHEFSGGFFFNGDWDTDYLASVCYYVYPPRKLISSCNEQLDFRSIVFFSWNSYRWVVPNRYRGL